MQNAVKELYQNEIKNPRPLARLVKVEQIGTTEIVTLEIFPISMPKKGMLNFSTSIDIKLKYRKGIIDPPKNILKKNEKHKKAVCSALKKPIHSRTQAKRLHMLALGMVSNKEDVVPYGDYFEESKADYLIITDSYEWDNRIYPTMPVGILPGKFKKLADWKAKKGLKSKVVTITDIVNQKYGDFVSGARDLQEVIRNFLKWAYKEWGIAWLLLGGDVNIIPFRFVTTFKGGTIRGRHQ